MLSLARFLNWNSLHKLIKHKVNTLCEAIPKCIPMRMCNFWEAMLKSSCEFVNLLENRSTIGWKPPGIPGAAWLSYNKYSILEAQLRADNLEQAIIRIHSHKVFSELLKSMTKIKFSCTSFENRTWGKNCQTRSLTWTVRAVLVFF